MDFLVSKTNWVKDKELRLATPVLVYQDRFQPACPASGCNYPQYTLRTKHVTATSANSSVLAMRLNKRTALWPKTQSRCVQCTSASWPFRLACEICSSTWAGCQKSAAQKERVFSALLNKILKHQCSIEFPCLPFHQLSLSLN